MNPPPHNIGDDVYVVYASSNAHVEVVCPICFGKRSVTLILGDGEHVPVECDFCGKGYEEPQGVVREWQATSKLIPTTVSGLCLEDGKWVVSTETGWQGRETPIFADRDEAEAQRLVLHAEAKEQAAKRWEIHQRGHRKNFTWSAGYHRSCIKKAKQELAWHEARLSAFKAKK